MKGIVTAFWDFKPGPVAAIWRAVWRATGRPGCLYRYGFMKVPMTGSIDLVSR